MSTAVIFAMVVIAAIVVIAGMAWLNSRNQSKKLAERFGPEYDRTMATADKRSDAEKELREREARVSKLHLKDLDVGTRQRFTDEWRRAQEHFVDDPIAAVNEVDDLVESVMNQRGYPVQDFEQQAADISVDHPEVVSNYRAAHAIAVAHESKSVSTEDLRQAMIHYRALFAELVEATPART
jgi:hypothetical protein